MSATYKTLTEMGVTNIDEITKYTLRTEGDEDVLKIYFRRAKGSILPRSVKFKMGRSKRMVVVDSGSRKTEEISEISPIMSRAVEELDQIAHRQHDRKGQKQHMLEELDHLEKVVLRKISDLREQIDAMD